ncbi:MAG: TauD/TfdA family dioxygenase [Saccharospirillum sp.]
MTIKIDSIPEQKQVGGLDFPLVVTPHDTAVAQDFSAFNDWVAEHKSELKAQLIKHGAVLFRGFPVTSADAFEAHLNHTVFENMPYVGGAAPRNQVTASRIVTANESPSSEKIPFHHEMAQTPNPPGYIFFYCDKAAQEGGATSILHSGEIYRRFHQINPAFADKMERDGVRYVRVMPEDTDRASAIGRSWKDTFQVTTRDDAERVMREAGMEWEWLDNGNLKTITRVLPAIQWDEETQQKVFFNAVVAVYTGWNDSRNEGHKAVMTGKGEPMDAQVMEETVKAMDELCVNFQWQEGDVLWISNYTVLHARQPFKGERSILASISFK